MFSVAVIVNEASPAKLFEIYSRWLSAVFIAVAVPVNDISVNPLRLLLEYPYESTTDP